MGVVIRRVSEGHILGAPQCSGVSCRTKRIRPLLIPPTRFFDGCFLLGGAFDLSLGFFLPPQNVGTALDNHLGTDSYEFTDAGTVSN